jgi:integration host factor subunit alpha
MMSVNKKPRTVIRQDIVDAVYREIGLSKSESSELVESIFTKISEKLIAGENVKLAKFGNFIIRDKTERVGRNPKTGTAVIIAPRRIVTFKPSPKMSARIAKELKKYDGDI